MYKPVIITALFDINREKLGDGRSINQYFEWFKRTLQINCDIVVFTENKFEDFVTKHRKENIKIITHKLSDLDLYKYKPEMEKIMKSAYFRLKIKNPSRIECFLPEYCIIQYSKFQWIKLAIESTNNYNFFFWMDAGCSRFFEDFDLKKEWPNPNRLISNKLIIQGNKNYTKYFKEMNPVNYLWDDMAMLTGTLFGGDVNTFSNMYNLVFKEFEKMIELGCVNNEQIILAILAKRHPELFNIIEQSNITHLPLFKDLS